MATQIYPIMLRSVVELLTDCIAVTPHMADGVVSMSGQPPVGFEAVPLVDVKGCPLAEDVGRKKKSLWLIRIPHNFDASLLSGKTAIINGTQEIPPDVEKGIERRYEVLSKTADTSELDSFRVLLPSIKTESLCVAQPFGGQMSVIHSLNVPPPMVPTSPVNSHRDALTPVPRGEETLDGQKTSKKKKPVDSLPKNAAKSSKSKKRQKEKERAETGAAFVRPPQADVDKSSIVEKRSKHKKRGHVEEHEIESPENSHHGTVKKKRKDKREDDTTRAMKETKDSKKSLRTKQLKTLVKVENLSDCESSAKKKKKKN